MKVRRKFCLSNFALRAKNHTIITTRTSSFEKTYSVSNQTCKNKKSWFVCIEKLRKKCCFSGAFYILVSGWKDLIHHLMFCSESEHIISKKSQSYFSESR